MSAIAPLAGIRVVELGGYIAAPYASSLLCGLGAEVVKIEQPEGGDAFRRNIDDRSPYFAQYNAGKKSVALDLRHPEGLRIVRQLLARADVFLENLRPGKVTAMGLGRDTCRQLNPALICASVSGFGSNGPLVSRPAYDSVGQSIGGLYSLLNDEGDARLTGTCIADLMTGVVTAMGVLAALFGRTRSGAGVDVETSMLESISALTIDAMTQLAELGHPPTRESRHPQAQSFVVTTSDGDKLTLHLSSSQTFWRRLAIAIDREDLLGESSYAGYVDRVENYAALRAEILAAFPGRTTEYWEKALNDADVPFAPVLDLAQVAHLPQTKLLELFTAAPTHNDLNLVRPPWRFDGARAERDPHVPRLGEHTTEILSTVLGPDEMDSVLDAGIAVQAETRPWSPAT